MFGRFWITANQMIVMVTDDAHAASFLYESIDCRVFDLRPKQPVVCPYTSEDDLKKEIN